MRSADVLEALDVAIEVPAASMERALREDGDRLHVRAVDAPRDAPRGPGPSRVAIPTVMNIVGPFGNPARAGRQVMGVADQGRVTLIAGRSVTWREASHGRPRRPWTG